MRIQASERDMGDQFPAGLRVLVVDDDRTCLAILKKMLLRCAYDVTTCGMARLALAMLRENKERFDVVLSDVCMPDMDGFKLLELVGLEMDLPVIMMSANGETSLVMKGIIHGACDYLLKPIRIKELKNIWQHVFRRKRNILKDADGADHDRQKRKPDEGDSMPAAGSAAAAGSKKRKEIKEDDEEFELDMDDSNTLKKPRVVWSVELHQQFVTAVNQLGIDKAVPKRILELMNVQGLTRENVASHLQKYRLYLKRLSVAQQQNAVTMSMPLGSDPSYNAIDNLQPHPIITPGSSQALAALRSAYLRTLCSSNDPAATNGVVEPPVLVVRPRSIPPNNQRGLLLGVGDMEQLQQSQVPQMRPVQEGILATSASQSNPLTEQIIQQQQQQHTQIQLLQPYNQKQDSYIDYSHYSKDTGDIGARGTTLDDGIIGRGFGGSIVASATGDGISVLMNSGLAKPNIPGMNTGIVKCEEGDSLGSWEGGSSAAFGIASQISWQGQQQQEQQGSQEFIHDTLVPYSSSGTGDGHEYLGMMNCPRIIANSSGSFKVKQEEYDSAPNQFPQAHHAQDELVGLQPYKQEQEHGFFENDLCLDGYIPGSNLYVK
ncbi:type B response regulator [Selaginella moellendorffii]|uniref:Type B response regulator n=1 Tax=Selaginella moellendorffii TaxID=88036 RepID=D8RDF0_SELML|nr:two-component response regulator ORR21 [Selaginella moellendorffii]EFJ30010.1 type B response regulator [Selaginella moellendorffii]|eukprot:XP_002968894.1 two-component response regulator ORR21 [Selaginella moellendorffii]